MSFDQKIALWFILFMILALIIPFISRYLFEWIWKKIVGGE